MTGTRDSLETLLAKYHQEVWDAAAGTNGPVDYDMAGVDTAKLIIAELDRPTKQTSIGIDGLQSLIADMEAVLINWPCGRPDDKIREYKDHLTALQSDHEKLVADWEHETVQAEGYRSILAAAKALQSGAGDGVQGLIQAVNTVLGDRKCTLPPEGCDSLGLTEARVFRCDLLELSEALANLDVKASEGFSTIRLDKDQAKLLREILSEASDRVADGGYMSKEIINLTAHIYEAIDNAQATEGK